MCDQHPRLKALVAQACKTIGSQWLAQNEHHRIYVVVRAEVAKENRAIMHQVAHRLHKGAHHG